ncbi:Phosphorylase b kinase gamma catalytic chain, liver/testis isoform [Geodia barretti]|uniref:phosphorylase kinase n=2 Tax=Geodia barretti TaxID=519541 RepID=A0AA35XA72_GEOBA|nr:Phosphorylase b kinase gamma catalytic chain, liver/testis isoform [Geodia barretti]
MVFELATGGELFDYLTKMVKLSEKRTRQVMFQLFTAVEHMHAHNIIHRDLKPENILLDDHLNVKVSDFGFATICEPGNTLSELLGTPGYLAPEMLRRNVEPGSPGYSHPVDMWACGVIMYTLLAGFPPFWHRKQLMMLRNIMDGKYEFVSPEWDIISDSAKDLISKLLVTDPGKRLTATEALNHPFLQFQQVEFRVFSGLRKFKGAVYCVWSCHAFEKMHSRSTPKTFTLASIGDVPYENRFVRQLVDSCAFHIYGHWVKRGEEQNRALLFETAPKKLSQIPTQALLSTFPRPKSLWSH